MEQGREQGRKISPEVLTAVLSVFFGKESKEISDKMEQLASQESDIDTNGTIMRRRQQLQHLEERLAELSHIHEFISRALTKATQTSGIPSIRPYFVGKLDDIDLKTEMTRPLQEVIIEGGGVKGKQQELDHLATLRADIIRVGDFVLGLLGEPTLVDEKKPTTI